MKDERLRTGMKILLTSLHKNNILSDDDVEEVMKFLD